MSNESKELAAKAKSFDSKKAVDLLLDNALYPDDRCGHLYPGV